MTKMTEINIHGFFFILRHLLPHFRVVFQRHIISASIAYTLVHVQELFSQLVKVFVVGAELVTNKQKNGWIRNSNEEAHEEKEKSWIDQGKSLT